MIIVGLTREVVDHSGFWADSSCSVPGACPHSTPSNYSFVFYSLTICVILVRRSEIQFHRNPSLAMPTEGVGASNL